MPLIGVKYRPPTVLLYYAKNRFLEVPQLISEILMTKPYQLCAKRIGDDLEITVWSKRGGRLLPITSGSHIPHDASDLPAQIFEAVRIELGKAGVDVLPNGKVAPPPATSGEIEETL